VRSARGNNLPHDAGTARRLRFVGAGRMFKTAAPAEWCGLPAMAGCKETQMADRAQIIQAMLKHGGGLARITARGLQYTTASEWREWCRVRSETVAHYALLADQDAAIAKVSPQLAGQQGDGKVAAL